MTAIEHSGGSLLSAFVRAVGLVALAIGAALAFVFAFVAALVVAAMVLGAALTLRFWRRPARVDDRMLEGRRTPEGWVVETVTRAR